MTPPARVQAAIDLIDAILMAARGQGASADTLARNFFRERRYMGSGDRRVVRDLAYRAVRRFGEIPANGRAAMAGLAREDSDLAALFDGSGYGPAALGEDEPVASGGVIPGWIDTRLPALFDTAEKLALLDRAALDLRFDPAMTDQAALQAHWPDIVFSDALPRAARLPNGTAIEDSDLWQRGAVDVQDWGSQAIVAACRADDAEPALVIDLCAGAGGKTLALSAMMPGARIIASDTSRDRLAAMEPRRRRAGADRIETLLLDPRREWERLEAFEARADVVLVDAPCSGSGTWRRNPETRWRLTPERLDRLVAEQARLIEIAQRLVRPGGALVYAVCSLLPDEGARQVARGLCGQPGWHISLEHMNIGRLVGVDGELAGSPEAARQPAGTLLTPHHDGTDGFFFTRALRSC